MKDILDLVENWDRAAGQLKRPPTPSDRSDGDEGHPPSGRKVKGKGSYMFHLIFIAYNLNNSMQSNVPPINGSKMQ